MKKRSLSLAVTLLFILTGLLNAAAGDVKEFADYAFLSQYKSIEVARVQDGTGEKVGTSVLEKVQSAIRQALKNRNLPVVMMGETPDPDKTLLLEVRLIKYTGGFGSLMGFAEMAADGKAVGGTGVTLFVRFKDKKLDTELGTVKVSRGGMSKDGNLTKSSDALVEIIKIKMYDEEGKKPVPVPVTFGGRSSSGGSTGVMSIAPGSNVAVLAFTVKNVAEEEAAIVGDILRTEIVNLGMNYYNVLDRQYVDKIMSEHTFAATGATTAEGAAALGKMMNAQKVVTGSLSKLMDSYFLTANMIDVQTGKIESAASGDYKTTDDMKQTIRLIANQLIRIK